MELETDFPERLRPGSTVYLGRGHTRTVIGGTRDVRGGLLIKLNGIDTPDAAGRHRNEIVYVTTRDRPALEAGKYYHHQIVGSTVVDEHGAAIGLISEILQTGANDVFVVQRSSGTGELLLPAIDSVVLQIDADNKLVRVRVPEVFDGTATSNAREGSGNSRRGESHR